MVECVVYSFIQYTKRIQFRRGFTMSKKRTIKRKFRIDTGNNDTKGHDPLTSTKFYFPSLVAKLPDFKTRELLARGNLNDGIIVVNGVGYAVGDIAKNHNIMKLRGSARYIPEWYQPIMLQALTRAYGGVDFTHMTVDLGAMYPPQDYGMFPSLEKSAKGEYEVISNMGTHHYTIETVTGIDEPLGVFATAWLTEKGEPRKNVKFGQQTILVVDVGGYSTDFVPIDENVIIDTSAMDSVVYGIQDIKDELEKFVRSEYQDDLARLGLASAPFSVASIEKALHTGYFKLSKKNLDVREFVDTRASRLANDTYTQINKYGGAIEYSVILMGGGGGAFLQPYLNSQFGDVVDFQLATDAKDMRFGGVLGLDRMLKMMDMG